MPIGASGMPPPDEPAAAGAWLGPTLGLPPISPMLGRSESSGAGLGPDEAGAPEATPPTGVAVG